MDETTKQCTREVRARIAAKPGQTEKYDGEYERNGVGHLMLFYAPLESGRRVQISDNHKSLEWAEGVRRLVQEDFPMAKCITLVMDNLSTRRFTLQSFCARACPRTDGETEIHLHAQT